MAFGVYRLSVLAGIALSATISGCGGDGGGGDGAVAPPPVVVPPVVEPPAAAAQFGGTAATGAALGNAPVQIVNTVGNSPCVEAPIVTSPLGSYTCTLKSGETAPFFIVVTDPTGNSQPMVSVATTTPAAGTPLTVNVTPLTTAIVAQLNGGDALGVVADKSKYVASRLATIKANVLAQISAVLTAINMPAGYDPFSTSITAATASQTGNTADQLLDVLKITRTATNELALSTVANPSPVVLATATTTGAAVDAPPTNVADLAKGAQLLALSLNQCFALPVAQRVTLTNGDISGVAAVCQSSITAAGLPSGAVAFKQNGYSFAQSFYSLLLSDAMTNASFGVPEIMAFYPATSSQPRDRATINIKYQDNTGYPGNQITTARRFEGTSTTARPSEWWITGNQWDIDISVRTIIRRTENFAPNTNSSYINGVAIHVNSQTSAPNATAFDSVHATGPGLPTLGLWYFREANSSLFTLSTRRDADPLPAITSLSPVCSGCVSYWMSRTQGISGSNATTYRDNPRFNVNNSVTSNNNTFQWAAYDGSDGSYNGRSGLGTRPTVGSVYTFDFYNGASLYKTETRTLLSNLVNATQGINLQWHGIGPNTTAALDPTNASLAGAQSSLLVDWVVNPQAEYVRSLFVSQTDGASENGTRFDAGVNSVRATPLAGTTFTQLSGALVTSGAPYSGYREVGLSYRILDGSLKHGIFTYHP